MRRLAFLLTLLIAWTAGAQQHPNVDRGFAADKVYQFGELDVVNPFNGSIRISIPIGQEYSLGGGLTYRLNLVYNSNVWDVRERVLTNGESTIEAFPNERSNAGLGWLLTLGELIDTNESTALGPAYVYLSPDGSEHVFWPTLHPGEAAYPDCSANPAICGIPGVLSVAYTRDGTYLRMRQTAADVREIDFPDGTTRRFRHAGSRKWRLEQIRDRFTLANGQPANVVNVTYPTQSFESGPCAGTPVLQKLSDTMGREHYICGVSQVYGATTRLMVSRVHLASFDQNDQDGVTNYASYAFSYSTPLIDRACSDNFPGNSTTVAAPLLTSVTLPKDNLFLPDARFEPSYHTAVSQAPDSVCQQGMIDKLVLPTRGAIRWTYQHYLLPAAGSFACDVFEDHLTQVTGVRTRQFLDASENELARWEYLGEALPPIEPSVPCPTASDPTRMGAPPTDEWKVTIISPGKDREVRYFSVWPRMAIVSSRYGSDARDYALPFTRRLVAPSEVFPAASGGPPAAAKSSVWLPLFLSSEHYDCDAAGQNCQRLRSTYVRYERDVAGPANTAHPQFDSNRRLVASQTVFHDDGDRWTATESDDFDGLGHYRAVTARSNFLGRPDDRTVVTRYNPTQSFAVDPFSGVQRGNFLPPSPAAPWLLETFTERLRWAGSSASGEREQFCFDASTGFLSRHRRLNDGVPTPNDTLAVFTPDAWGQTIRQEFFGGDTQSIGTQSDVCSVPLPGHTDGTFRIDHVHPSWNGGSYSAGKTSTYVAPAGNPILRIRDEEIDRATGLVAVSRDPAGVETRYGYDSNSRLTTITPAAGHDGRTSITYGVATNNGGFAPAIVDVVRYPNSLFDNTILQREQTAYDAIGRVAGTYVLQPSGAWSTRSTTYDSSGRVATRSELGSPSQVTTYAYDSFGRPVTITPPDGAAHATTFSYAGARVTNRTVMIRRTGDATSRPEEPSVTSEIRDGFGNVAEVHQPAGAGGGDFVARYGYDTSDRLISVSLTDSLTALTQRRGFTYDKRGLLVEESHPETGAIHYPRHDARGHVLRRRYSTDCTATACSPFDLTYTFDGAERLTTVEQTLPPGVTTRKIWKSYVYATDNDPAGCVTGFCEWRRGKRLTTTRYHYDEFGNESRVDERYFYAGRGGRVSMRNTASVGRLFSATFEYDDLGNVSSIMYPSCLACGTAPSRTVSYQYSAGLLTFVPGFATLTHHPNGTIHTVAHLGGPTDTYHADPNGMARPAKITSVGSTIPFDSGTYRYDGAQNITAIGSDYYRYDGVSRIIFGTAFQAGSNKTQAYTYDAFGNITSRHTPSDAPSPTGFAVDPATNRLGDAVYDEAGNMTSRVGHEWRFDPFNMVSFTSRGGGTRYAYTVDDERLLTYRGDGTLEFTLRDLGHRVLRTFTTPGGSWSWKDYVYRDGQLLASVTPTETLHYTLDHLGTPRVVTGAQGIVKALRTYYPFGQEATSVLQAVSDSLRFTAHERDFHSSGDDYLDYMHARYHDPLLGRFLSVDPIRGIPDLPQTWNRYSYAVNNPVSFTDPFGLYPCPVRGSDGIERTGECIDVTEKDDSRKRTTAPRRWLMEFKLGLTGRKAYTTPVRAMNAEIQAQTAAVSSTWDRFMDELSPDTPGELALAALPVGRLTKNWKWVCKKFGINEHRASAIIHKIKKSVGRGGADDVLFDKETGDIIAKETGEVLGHLDDY